MTVEQWIESEPFQFKRTNERPWGSYQLAVSTDGGISWGSFERSFGSRISEIEAFKLVLTDCMASDILKPQLIAWLGEIKVQHIADLLNGTVQDVRSKALSAREGTDGDQIQE